MNEDGTSAGKGQRNVAEQEVPRDPTRAARIRDVTRRHVFTSWAAHASIDPVPLAGGSGAWLWDYEGNRWLDFTSQLVNANLGYQHPRLLAAIREATEELVIASPNVAHESRAEAARLVAEVAPEGLDKVFFTTGGAEAVEHAVRMARVHTGRHKLLASYRSYHGSTAAASTLTGEQRRWGTEPGLPGVVHFWGPHLYRSTFGAQTEQEESERALEHLRQTVAAEGPHLIAAIILESVVGTNGILVPPQGYLQGVRELCDEHGILLIADEVMAGFGRTGRWFAFERWGIIPDLITFAKGVNSGYIPLGGVVISDAVAATFDHLVYPGGATYNGHPLACASAVASIGIMREDGVIEHADALGESVLGPRLRELLDRHEVVGDVRGLGVFWAVELVSDRQSRQPLAADRMAQLLRACRAQGVWPLVVGNRLHIVPPCVITADEAAEGVDGLDRALKAVAT